MLLSGVERTGDHHRRKSARFHLWPRRDERGAHGARNESKHGEYARVRRVDALARVSLCIEQVADRPDRQENRSLVRLRAFHFDRGISICRAAVRHGYTTPRAAQRPRHSGSMFPEPELAVITSRACRCSSRAVILRRPPLAPAGHATAPAHLPSSTTPRTPFLRCRQSS